MINLSYRVCAEMLLSSRRRKKGMSQKSLIPILTPIYNALSTPEKEAWASAGAINNSRSFNLFLRDTSYRIKNSIAGYATPNDIYQVLQGKMTVGGGATSMKIAQLHPFKYFILKKIVGTKTQYEPVQITETFQLPLQIEISYKTNLTSAGSGAFAKFFVIVNSHYQGRNIETPLEISFDLVHTWDRLTATLSSVVGVVTGYTGYIEIHNATGDLWFDNVTFFHDSFNWARDPFCNSIRTDYTRAFYQIPRDWIGIDLPDGAFYDSLYYN